MGRLLLALLLSAGLAGCGGDGDATAPPSGSDHGEEAPTRGRVLTPEEGPGVRIDLGDLAPLSEAPPLTVAPRDAGDWYERTVYYATTRDDQSSRLARLAAIV